MPNNVIRKLKDTGKKIILIRKIYDVVRHVDICSFRLFLESIKILWLCYQIRNHTLVDIARLKMLYKLTKEIDAASVPGDIVECGVFKGGSAALIARAARKSPFNRSIWLFDSFEGLPRPTKDDGLEALEKFHKGWNRADIAEVKRLFQKLSSLDSRTHIVKGYFQDTFQLTPISQIALLHIDADWYHSVRICLERFYDFVQPGGFIALDDYGRWEGCRKATDEFIGKHGLKVKLVPVDGVEHYFQKPND